MNNCVGIGNHKLFLLFILYIFLMCTYALLLVVARYAGCLHSGGDDEISCGDGTLIAAPCSPCVLPGPAYPFQHCSPRFIDLYARTNQPTHIQRRATCWSSFW